MTFRRTYLMTAVTCCRSSITLWKYAESAVQIEFYSSGKVKQAYIDDKISSYITDIVFATRYPEKFGLDTMRQNINFGASPRASINLALAARTYAFIKRRGYVIPEDVRAMAHDVLRHRIGLTYEAEAENITSDAIVTEILNKVQVP